MKCRVYVPVPEPGSWSNYYNFVFPYERTKVPWDCQLFLHRNQRCIVLAPQKNKRYLAY